MACSLDLKLVIKHLANGTICENLCRVCLKPLTDDCENIFTKICKEDKEYCIANVLQELCQIQIADSDHYSVCRECFIAASNAYKFYLNTKCNDKLLNYYADKLDNYLKTITMTDGISAESNICISLPVVTMEMSLFDYNIQSRKDKSYIGEEISIKYEKNLTEDKKPIKSEEIKNDDYEIIMVKDESGQSTFYKMRASGGLEKVECDIKFRVAAAPIAVNNSGVSKRKKRDPMTSKKCTRCPIQYRFIAKLQEHMRTEHGVTLYSCKVCQALTEDEEFHNFHIKTHTRNYKCDICSVTFKKRDAVMNHMRDHEVNKHKYVTDDFVCVQCGLIMKDQESLSNHVNMCHYKKFACYYCGRIYKVKESFDKHIRKHEMYTNAFKEKTEQEKRPFTTAEAKKLIANSEAQEAPVKKDFTCELCGRGFLGARALLWHGRLHSNERPFKCDTCGRAFVSLNRRNQHALCAHAPPARRCPLCPARFHLRSMVNTHVKKVHLKPHKRRARTRLSPPPERAPPAAPVPVQELSVALQQHVLELQARATPPL